MRNLKKLRELRGFTRAEMAAKLGIDKVSYGRYERGEREPTIEKLFALGEILRVRIESLYGEDEIGPRDIYLPIEATFQYSPEVIVSIDVKYCDFPANQKKHLSNLLASVAREYTKNYYNRHDAISQQISELRQTLSATVGDVDSYLERLEEFNEPNPQGEYPDKIILPEQYNPSEDK